MAIPKKPKQGLLAKIDPHGPSDTNVIERFKPSDHRTKSYTQMSYPFHDRAFDNNAYFLLLRTFQDKLAKVYTELVLASCSIARRGYDDQEYASFFRILFSVVLDSNVHKGLRILSAAD
jgi:hypothetical protein